MVVSFLYDIMIKVSIIRHWPIILHAFQICGQVVEYNSDNTFKSVSKGCMDHATADENLGCTMNGGTKVCKNKCLKTLCNKGNYGNYNYIES